MNFLQESSLNFQNIDIFKTVIWDHFKTQGRTFAWRSTNDPYHIMVSEVMLQQTQTYRVEPKYDAFIKLFPTFEALASAPVQQLILAWQGLGYNRRALSLQKSAQKVMAEFAGILPNDPEVLVTFPGIGKATASSICAFAFNKPTIFIETNIRAVFIHFFFAQRQEVHDKEILPLVAATVDQTNPREWYYALMDYGVVLKKQFKNPSRRSAHHAQQSRFEGSDRQIRGMILKALTQHTTFNYEQLCNLIARDPQRIQNMLNDLIKEGFIRHSNGILTFS